FLLAARCSDFIYLFFFSSRRRHTRFSRDWSSDVCSSDLDYLTGMGFDDNAYALWQHFDADHLHIHVLASRIKYDGSVVSDSNNRSEERRVGKDCGSSWYQIVYKNIQTVEEHVKRNSVESQ